MGKQLAGSRTDDRTDTKTFLIIVASSILALVVGWALGALPITGVEPGAVFYNCGPAVFGRPSPLPHPACSGAYDLWGVPLSFLSGGFIALGAIGIALAVVLTFRRPTSRGRSSAPGAQRVA